MLILLTNDDGITAPGIVAMFHALRGLGEIHVVAPATVQSATGHGITLATPLLTSKVTVGDDFSGIAVEGRPADCVKLAFAKLLPRRPDLVISGMNSGANVGINVIYSGTVAAAIEAAFLGVASIAVSLYLRKDVPIDYPRATKFARQTIDQIISHGLPPGRAATINIPALKENEMPAGVRVAPQSTHAWIDTYEQRTDPRGRDYFWNSSVFSLGTHQEDTDVAALREKYITVTPLQFDMTDHALARRWQSLKWQAKPPL
jgi:5'-nucleotidase